MCYSLWYNAPTMLPASGRQHRGGCIIPQTGPNKPILLSKFSKFLTRHMRYSRITYVIATIMAVEKRNKEEQSILHLAGTLRCV